MEMIQENIAEKSEGKPEFSPASWAKFWDDYAAAQRQAVKAHPFTKLTNVLREYRVCTGGTGRINNTERKRLEERIAFETEAFYKIWCVGGITFAKNDIGGKHKERFDTFIKEENPLGKMYASALNTKDPDMVYETAEEYRKRILEEIWDPYRREEHEAWKAAKAESPAEEKTRSAENEGGTCHGKET